MIRLTQKELRGLVREVMEGGLDEGFVEALADSLSQAHEQLQTSLSAAKTRPELDVVVGMLTEAEQNVAAVLDELNAMLPDPFA